MKRLVLAAAGLGALFGMGFYLSRPKAPIVPPAEITVEFTTQAASAPAIERPQTVKEVVTIPEKPASLEANVSAQIPSVTSAAKQVDLSFNQAVETLVSPQTGYEQKQAIWKQLKTAGKLDQAIGELEQRVAGDPRSAESVTALGAGYYKKAGATEDVREKAILAMKADQTLEAALNLDAANWEARFTKAVGMSYWPPELNKGQEVIEQFQMLIQQQETQTPQPQFARSYLRLGEQYQKVGNPEYATQVWLRGAAFFPNDTDLKGKMVSAR